MDSVVRHRRIILGWAAVCGIVAIALFASQLFEIRARSALRGYDNTFNYLWLRSAMIDRDWDFRNDLIECDTLTPEYRASALNLPVTRAGRIPNKYGVGWAVVTPPFFLIADFVVWLGHATGAWNFPGDGFSAPYQICIQIGHALLAGIGLFLALRAVVGWVGDRSAAVVGVLMVWAASPLLYYQTTNLSMSHGVGFVAIAALAALLNEISKRTRLALPGRDASPRRPRTARRAAPTLLAEERGRPGAASLPWLWALAGVSWSLALVTRFQLAVFGVAAGWVLLSAKVTPANWTKNVAAFLSGAVPLLALQAYAWHSVYGEWWLFSYGAEGETFYWGKPELLRSLFSSWHGLFYWHPLLLPAFVGMIVWAVRQRDVAIAWALAVMLTVYVSAAWWCWWFASSFGNRSYDAAILPLMAGFAWLFQRANARMRTVLLSLGILAGTWNFYLVLLYRSGAISRAEPVSWSEMIAAAVRLREAVQF
jgi:hypothetical protein